SWAMVGSGVMAIWSVRHPRFLIRWGKRGLGIWSTWRMVKGILRQSASR
ncbi:YqjK family protein, partial [Klebsiella aerogenes]